MLFPPKERIFTKKEKQWKGGILFRLEDGGQTLYHATGIVAQPGEASRNQTLRSELNRHCLAMCKAYTLMQLRQMDMNGRIFESEVSRMLAGRFTEGCSGTDEPIYDRLVRNIEEARRDGVIGPRFQHRPTAGVPAFHLRRNLAIHLLSLLAPMGQQAPQGEVRGKV